MNMTAELILKGAALGIANLILLRYVYKRGVKKGFALAVENMPEFKHTLAKIAQIFSDKQ